MVGLLSLSFKEIAVGECFCESTQNNIVGRKPCVSHTCYVLDVQRVNPCGVLTERITERRFDAVVREGYLFCLLRELVVAVLILQGVDAIVAWCHTTYYEVSARVGTSHTQHRFLDEARVFHLAIQSYEYSLDWFEIVCLHHVSRHLESVDVVAGREAVGVIAQGIALVVVADGIGEVDGVGGVGFQRVLQLHLYLLAGRLYFGLLQLRWRHHNLLGGVVELDELVEVDVHLICRHVHTTIGRRCTNHTWRSLVIPSAIWATHTGTRSEKEQEHKRKQKPYMPYIPCKPHPLAPPP